MIKCIESFGETHMGRRRDVNEDTLFFDDGLGVYVVADGMGGQNAGEVASRTAIDVVVSFIRRTNDREITWPFGIIPHLSYNGNRLRTAVMLANKRVWRDAENRQEYVGMGATIVAALVADSALTLCSAGDCRAYRVRGSQLDQLTTDDSWVQEAFSAGAMDAERVHEHPLRNVVTKAVGATETIDLDVIEAPIESGDLYLLCSDGLHGMISDSRILEIVLPTDRNLQRKVRDLINAANDGGGKDNITALLMRCGSS